MSRRVERQISRREALAERVSGVEEKANQKWPAARLIRLANINLMVNIKGKSPRPWLFRVPSERISDYTAYAGLQTKTER
jgi:hypothetical protein